MNSLIIGGTSGFGKNISERLESLGADIITISRSIQGIHRSSRHFQCDVLDRDKLTDILDKIKRRNYAIDNIWCVVGYAYPTKVENQTHEVVGRHMAGNFIYVQSSLEILKDNLSRSKNPFVVTFGSQWSYRTGEDCPELIPYANAKNALMKYTHEFSLENPKIRANHYCIPSCETASFRRIEETIRQIKGKELIKSHTILANPGGVANSLVNHALNFQESGKTLMIRPDGLVEILNLADKKI